MNQTNMQRADAIEAMRHSFVTACSKLGVPEAVEATGRRAFVLGGDSLADMHEKRKTLRRAANKFGEALEANGSADKIDRELGDAITFVGHAIAELTGRIDGYGDARRGAPTGQRALRTADEFRAFYAAESPDFEPEQRFGVGDFFRAVAGMRAPEAAQRALSVGTNSAGGYTVPNSLMPNIMASLVPVSSLLMAGAGIIPLDSGAKTMTWPAVSTIPTAAWRAEGGTVAATDPVFRAVVATPQSLSFRIDLSRELLADSEGLDAALQIAIAQSFAKEMDRAGLRGSGTAPEIRGILNTSGIQAVTNGTNGASLANYSNIFSAVQAILQADAPMPTAAIMSPRSLIRLGGLLDSTSQPMRVPDMIKPINLIATSQVPNALTVGTSSDCSEIYLGDFSTVSFVLRESPSVFLSRDLLAGTGQVSFICHARLDLIVRYPAALALVTGVRP